MTDMTLCEVSLTSNLTVSAWKYSQNFQRIESFECFRCNGLRVCIGPGILADLIEIFPFINVSIESLQSYTLSLSLSFQQWRTREDKTLPSRILVATSW